MGPRASLPLRLLLKTHKPMWRRFTAPRHGPVRGWGPPGGTSPTPSTRHEVLSDLGSPGPALKGLCCSQPAFGSRRLLLHLRAITRRAGAAYGRLPCSTPGSGAEEPGVHQGRVRGPHGPRWDGTTGSEEIPEPKLSLQGISLPPHGDVLLSASRPTPQDGGPEGTHQRPMPTSGTDKSLVSSPCRLRASPTVTLTTAITSHINQR